MKKLIALLLAATSVLSCFTGCGNKTSSKVEEGTSQSAQVSTVDSEKKVNLVWGGWSGEEEATKDIFKRMIDGYHSKTGNDVTWVGWTWADTAQQLLIRSQGSEQLDIAQVDISIFNVLAKADVLADFNDIIGKDKLENMFEKSTLDVGNVDGKQLAIPWSMASITMVYNPQLLKKAGWDHTPTTIDDFEKCLADIKKMDPSIIPYGVATKDTTCAGDFMPWLWTFGGSVFNQDGSVAINSEQAIECVNWYKDMLAKEYIAMDIGRGDARQMFAQGKIAFYDDAVLAKGQAVHNGVKPDDVSKVCSAMLRPVLKSGDNPQSTMWGHMLVIFKKSKLKKQAAEFAQYLVSDDVALDYFRNNGMPPVTKELSAKDEIKNDTYLNGFIKATTTARLEETAKMTNADKIKTILTEELQAALLGKKDAKTAVADMESRLKSLS